MFLVGINMWFKIREDRAEEVVHNLQGQRHPGRLRDSRRRLVGVVLPVKNSSLELLFLSPFPLNLQVKLNSALTTTHMFANKLELLQIYHE